MARFIILPLIFCVFVAINAIGEPSPSTKPFYVINIQRVINESAIGKAARQLVEDEIKRSKGKLSQSQAEIAKLREEIAKQSAVLSKTALDEKQDLLEKKERDLDRIAGDSEDAIKNKNSAAIEKIVASVDSITKDLAKTEGYEFIFEADPRFIVYSNPNYDLTDKVIALLDKQRKSL